MFTSSVSRFDNQTIKEISNPPIDRMCYRADAIQYFKTMIQDLFPNKKRCYVVQYRYILSIFDHERLENKLAKGKTTRRRKADDTVICNLSC